MKKQWAILIVMLLLALSLVLVFWDRLFSTKGRTSGTGTDAGTGTSPETSVFPLKLGSRGGEVLKLQQYLNKYVEYYLVLNKLTEDGVFGQKTEGMCVTITGNKEISEDFYKKHIK